MDQISIVRGVVLSSGMSVRVTLQCGEKIEGILNVVRSDRFYICHNNRGRAGSVSPELWGMKHSWVFNYNIHCDAFTEDVVSVEAMCPDSKKVHVSSRLMVFINFLNLDGLKFNPMVLFAAKVKQTEAYTHFDLCDRPGMITMSGKLITPNGEFDKKVDIKFSRFVRGVVSGLAGDDKQPNYNLDDRDVERMYNSLVAYQSDSLFTMEMLSGESILQGYTKSMYANAPGSTLHKSCMTDKLGMLSLYVDNPQVRLAVLRSSRGIEARCLVWQSEDGTQYSDRRYYTQEWIGDVLARKLQDSGMRAVADMSVDNARPYIAIKLDSTDYEKYPYVDNFRYLDHRNGILYATYGEEDKLPIRSYRVLANTDGSYIGRCRTVLFM